MVKLLSKTFLILLIFGLIVISPVSYYFNSQYTYVYAESVTEAVNRDDLVEAFLAYCKSRDLTIEGTVADAVTSFTTRTFNLLCNTLGIDITALQSEIYKAYTQSSDGLPKFSHYIFSASGIMLMNRIFAQFLQDNELQVGDTDVNKVLKSGKYFVDADGNGCWVFIVKSGLSVGVKQSNNPSDFLEAEGTAYLLDDSQFKSLSVNTPVTAHVIDNSSFSYVKGSNGTVTAQNLVNMSRVVNNSESVGGSERVFMGAVCYFKQTNDLCFGVYRYQTAGYSYTLTPWVTVSNLTAPDADVTAVTTDDEPIKPDLPDDEPLDIYPDGSTSNDPEHNVPDPGGDDPGWTIPDGTITPDGNGGSTFDWNFQLPDLNINWSLNGLTEKFPFCIPFDVVSFCRVLSAEPVAPRITGNVPIGTLTTWTFDYDLSEYNSWASLFRTVELFGFVIGLIFITVKLVKG